MRHFFVPAFYFSAYKVYISICKQLEITSLQEIITKNMWDFTVKNALITQVCQFHVIYAYKSTIFISHFISQLHGRCGDARCVSLAPLYKLAYENTLSAW
jgi:hypothetical protein